MQHEILDKEVLVAFEAGAWRNLHLEDTLLADSQPFALATLGAAFLALAGRLGLGALVHAARLHPRSALQALEGRNLSPQLGDRLASMRHSPPAAARPRPPAYRATGLKG